MKKFRIVSLSMALLMLMTLLGGCFKEQIDYSGTTGPIATLAPQTTPTAPSVAVDAPLEEENQEPQPTVYTLSFAGDCTFGTEHGQYGNAGTFVNLVGENYEYPLAKALAYFQEDDFTLVNLEGALTETGTAQDKEFRFRGPMTYAKILVAGNVEAVNLANNHSYDFGETGYQNTKQALEAESITYVERDNTTLYTTESGLKIGMYAIQFWASKSNITKAIETLRAEGAEIVIVSYHGGVEGSYTPTADQKSYAHTAIDAGADIFFGHHPHVLQPVEQYNNGVIYYSLGNFSFGGNRNPVDKDTAIIQQQVVRELDGTIHLGETKLIPFSLSSETTRNTYQPTPYEADSDAYLRTMSKLDGTFAAPSTTPAETTPATTVPPTTVPPTTVPPTTVPPTTVPPTTVPPTTVPPTTVPPTTVPPTTVPPTTVPPTTVPPTTAPVETTPTETAPEASTPTESVEE